MTQTNYSFKKGYRKLRVCDVENFRADAMKTLGDITEQTFRNRLNGKVVPRMDEVNAIETLFKKYGVTDIWGE